MAHLRPDQLRLLKFGIRRALKTGSVVAMSVGSVALNGIACAQESGSRTGLEEITVTATRMSEGINRVPLSITAVTQDTLDVQGIKSSVDLVRTVPGLSTVANLGGAQQTFAIRGIVGGTGAATTSIYLDDTNLTKRANGGVAQNNGVIVPLLYDLARIEVLKGPQGTLYGGSSEGGTVRYITPTPSLTEHSGSVRAELSTMGSRGEPSDEISAAFGGPIVDDKLGFRVSGIRRETGGWIDVYSAYNNQLIKKDANSVLEWAVRGTLLWQIADRFTAQLAEYHVGNRNEGGPGSSTALFMPNQQPASAGATFTTTQRCITSNTRPASSPLAQPNGAAAATFIPANAICATPSGVFTRPAVTYGPFITGQDISLATGRQDLAPATSDADIGNFTLNYDFQNFSVKSITSYLRDEGDSDSIGGEEWSSATPGAGQTVVGDPLAAGHRGFPLFQAFYNATGGRGHTGNFIASNKRHGIEEELRVSSAADNRFTWVGGAFFSASSTHILYHYDIDPAIGDLVMRLMYGPGMAGPPGNTSASAARYGVIDDQGFQARLEANIFDKEYAAFGEGNFWIVPEHLKATLGLRISRVSLDYLQTNYGQFSSRLESSIGSTTVGAGSNTPVTPKVGLQYQITDNKMVYATASKGFRAGGVNGQISQTICQTALDALGITAADVPPAYKPDSVWSYELGTKIRLGDSLQVNIAAFQIDWQDIQATTTLSCGQGFTSSGGKARSSGGELQVEYRPFAALSFYLNAGYTDAHYIDPVIGPHGAGVAAPQASFNAGDRFNVPPVQVSGGVQYDVMLATNMDAYARLDSTYQREYVAGSTFGSSGYGTNYFTQKTPKRDQLNLRLGLRMSFGLEVNAFVQNLLDKERQVAGFGDGRGQCSSTVTDCSVYTSYSPFVLQTFQTPRVFGLQANYKF